LFYIINNITPDFGFVVGDGVVLLLDDGLDDVLWELVLGDVLWELVLVYV